MNQCKVVGCPRRVDAKGMCKNHYELARLHGDLPVTQRCTVDGCDRPHKAKGLCKSHYEAARNRARRGMRRQPCGVDECGNLAKARGMCQSHYDEAVAEGLPVTSTRRTTCRVALCRETPHAQGLCVRHYEIRLAGQRPFLPSQRTPCAGRDDVWIPVDDPGPAAAWQLCRGCPCLTECADYAAVHAPSVGIWAGIFRGVQ